MTMSQIDIKEIEKRVQFAALQDGVMEIILGLFLILFGGALIAKMTISPFAVFAIFFLVPIYKRIKQRYIYPRAGYVKLPQETDEDSKGIAIAVVIFIFVLLGTLGLSLWWLGLQGGLDFWGTYILPPFSGFMFAIGPFWLGQTYGLKRGYLWAGLFLCGGIIVPLSGIAIGFNAVGLFCILMGTLILITGTVLFIRFIRKYPPESHASESTIHAS